MVHYVNNEKCHVCNISFDREIPQLQGLYDGRIVRVCLHCKRAMNEGLEVAYERGIVSLKKTLELLSWQNYLGGLHYGKHKLR